MLEVLKEVCLSRKPAKPKWIGGMGGGVTDTRHKTPYVHQTTCFRFLPFFSFPSLSFLLYFFDDVCLITMEHVSDILSESLQYSHTSAIGSHSEKCVVSYYINI